MSSLQSLQNPDSFSSYIETNAPIWRSQMKDKLFRLRTQSLFWESRIDSYPPIFTCKDYHIEKENEIGEMTLYPSLQLIYMSYPHIPNFEYEFAQEIFGSWDHWTLLATSSQYAKYIKRWREELEIKNKAKAIREVMIASTKQDNVGVNAAKYLVEIGFNKRQAGRPSKEEVERERKIAAGVSKDLEQDMQRLGLSVINGKGI